LDSSNPSLDFLEDERTLFIEIRVGLAAPLFRASSIPVSVEGFEDLLQLGGLLVGICIAGFQISDFGSFIARARIDPERSPRQMGSMHRLPTIRQLALDIALLHVISFLTANKATSAHHLKMSRRRIFDACRRGSFREVPRPDLHSNLLAQSH
jgi:hypothetical protein